LFKVGQGKTRFLPFVSLLLGLSFSFEAATAIFLFPTVALFLFWNKTKVTLKNYIVSISVLIVTLLPQLLFELRHNFLMTNSLIRYLTTKESFGGTTGSFLKERLLYFLENIKTTLIVREELFKGQNLIVEIVIIFSLLVLVYKSFKPKKESLPYRVIFVWIFVSLLGLLFYKNSIWGWYMIPLFPAFALLPVVLFKSLNKYLTFLILGLIIIANSQMWISPGKIDDKTRWVLLRDQKKAVDFVYEDSVGRPFRVDVYVPYVIDYPYQYLWLWYGQKKYKSLPSPEREDLLYLIVEPNIDKPSLRQAWIDRHKTEGKVVMTKEIDPGIVIIKYEKN